MNRAKLILATLAVMTLNLAATPLALAKAKCPDGAYWDQNAKKCVAVPRGSHGE